MIRQFQDAIRAAGIKPPDHIVADGKLHRFSTNGKGDDSGWYVLHLDGVPAGSFGDWRTDLSQTWSDKSRKMTKEERTKHMGRILAMQQQREAEEAKGHEEAVKQADKLWAQATPVIEHPYLTKKGIQPHGLRVSGEILLVPMRDTNGKLWNLERIYPDGQKKGLLKGRRTGLYFALGNPEGTICVCEGFATGASIHEATGLAVAVAFNAGNLLPVAKALRAKFPELTMVIAGDDDYRTEGNVGKAKATEAALAVGGRAVFPVFNDRPEGATDFNDLHMAEGNDAVQEILMAAIPKPHQEQETASTGTPDVESDQPDGGDQPDDPIAEAIAKLKDDAGAIFEPAILELLKKAKADPAMWARYRQAIKDSKKVSMADLESLLGDKGGESGDEMFNEVDPWPVPVDGALMLNEIATAIRRHLVADEPTIRAAALWATFTWMIDVVGVAPIANITAPEKRCGKTVLLGLIGKLSSRPLIASNIAPAALFRSVEMWHPTLLIDEADSFLKDNEEVRGILNSGFTRDSAFVIRCVGDDHMPTRFDTWGAKVLCGIGALSATLHDRSIPLRLRRKLAGERVENLRHADPVLFDTLTRKLARWANDHKATIRRSRPTPIAGLNDRANDCWEPLLAIAEAAGGHWPAHARVDALALHGVEDEPQSAGVELLQDIHAVFVQKKAERLFTADLLQALVDNDEAPWATWNRGKQMTPRQLAKKLEDFGIRPKQLYINSTNKNGYKSSDFDEAFIRYATSPDRHTSSGTPSPSSSPLEPSDTKGFEGFAPSSAGGNLGDAKTPKPAPIGHPRGLEDRNPPPSDEGHVEVEI